MFVLQRTDNRQYFNGYSPYMDPMWRSDRAVFYDTFDDACSVIAELQGWYSQTGGPIPNIVPYRVSLTRDGY